MSKKDTIYSAINKTLEEEVKSNIENTLKIHKDKGIISFDLTLNEKTLRERLEKNLFNELKKLNDKPNKTTNRNKNNS
jgi:hypothetical protein